MEKRLPETREAVISQMLKSYAGYYNITQYKEEQSQLVARCDFFEHAQKYVISRKAELWSADSEEFLYIFVNNRRNAIIDFIDFLRYNVDSCHVVILCQ